VGVARFNLVCKLVALIILVGGLALSDLTRPQFRDLDFWQFYIAGIMAREGMWEHLYPTPLAGNPHNPGAPEDSTVSPEYQAVATAAGVELSTRFIQFPPNALLYLPLSLFSPVRAFQFWLLAMALFGWAIALQAGHIYRILGRADTRAIGMIVLLVACSPLMYRTVRVGNISPIIGWSLGIGIIALIRGMEQLPDRRARRITRREQMWDLIVGAALVIGTMGKYITVLLVPLFAFREKWRPLAYALAVGGIVTGFALAIMGSQPFKTFFETIAPTLGRSHEQIGNQSLQGLLLRLTETTVLPDAVAFAFFGCKWTVFVFILGWIVRRRNDLKKSPELVCASAMARLGWGLVFAPLFWEHYLVYLCPLWGWLIYQATRRHSAAVLAATATVVLTSTFPPVRSQTWAELANTRPLVGTIIIWGIAIWYLIRLRPQDPR
jgi:hypothetical protein